MLEASFRIAADAEFSTRYHFNMTIHNRYKSAREYGYWIEVILETKWILRGEVSSLLGFQGNQVLTQLDG